MLLKLYQTERDIKMQCPECKFQNPDDMQFCGKCGSKIALICPGCGFENLDGFSFCGECGESLSSEPQPAGDAATGAIPSSDKGLLHVFPTAC